MTVLITGGSGFVGSHIAEQLCRKGTRVRAIVRKTSDTSFLETLDNIEIARIPLDDVAGMREAVKGIDAIIHAAGLVKARNEEDFMRVNVEYTKNILIAAEHARETLKRFVLVSSLSAVGPGKSGEIIRNDTLASPLTRYGRSKLAAEKVAKEHSAIIPLTILRPVAIYGPRDKAVLPIFRCIKHRFLPYIGSPDTRLVVLYVADFARACICAIHADVPSGSSYLVDDGHVYTWRELFTLAESTLGKKAWIRLPLPKPLLLTVASFLDFYGRISKKAFMLSKDKLQELHGEFITDGADARRKLDWEPDVTLERGLRYSYAWYRENGWL